MRTALATMRAAMAEAMALRAAFWTQLTVMAINDVVWILFWQLLFQRVGSIRGWDVTDVMTLFAITATVVGISMGPMANARRLGEQISNGGLDAILTTPADPLSYLIVRRVSPLALGDAVFGIGLLLIVVRPTPAQFALFCGASLLGAIVFTSFMVLLNSFSFWTGGRGEQADHAFNFAVTVGMYPIDLFGGLMKTLLFTALPVAFMTAVPSKIVSGENPAGLLLLAGVALVMVVLARTTFNAGLRRYSSGSTWTRA